MIRKEIYMDINSSIKYNYPYAWNEMSGSPKVNMLLAALIKNDIIEAERLIKAGASLKAIDNRTFEHALFHILKSFETVKFMTKHGFSHIAFPHIKCIDGGGYMWDLTGRAYVLNKRGVLELLFSKGFEPGQFWINDNTYQLCNYAMRNNYTDLIDILLSHGYPKERLINEISYYARKNDDACIYVNNAIVLNWKSYGLGDLKREIPRPTLPQPAFFMTKRKKERYELQKESYEQEIAIRNKYLSSLAAEEKKQIATKDEFDKMVSQAMQEVIKDNPERFSSDSICKTSIKKTCKSESNSKGNATMADDSFYNTEMRDMEQKKFIFVDAKGNYRHWGDDFIDASGSWVKWGEAFVDNDGNYVEWGDSFVDAGGYQRHWGDDFIDGAGNLVKCPRE